jgi:hypothetical protein
MIWLFINRTEIDFKFTLFLNNNVCNIFAIYGRTMSTFNSCEEPQGKESLHIT